MNRLYVGIRTRHTTRHESHNKITMMQASDTLLSSRFHYYHLHPILLWTKRDTHEQTSHAGTRGVEERGGFKGFGEERGSEAASGQRLEHIIHADITHMSEDNNNIGGGERE